MDETVSVDLLGETPKEKWLNAINIYQLGLQSNISAVRAGLDEGCDISEIGFDACECLDNASRILRDFVEEMRRLVEGVF